MAAGSRALAFVAALALAAAPAPEIEEAADLARRAAAAAMRGQTRLLSEVLDADAILQARLGASVWERLTARQRGRLRAVVRGSFAAALAPPRGAAGEVAWSAAAEGPDGTAVLLGLRFGDRLVKTRWRLARLSRGAWRLEDVELTDPGVSLARASLAALGPSPLRARDGRGEARRVLGLTLAVLAAIAAAVAVFRRRLGRESRTILYLTAAAPALLFAIGGGLAACRSLTEPYELSAGAPAPSWDRWLRLARETERAGDPAAADPLWARAVAAGAPAGPAAYERGMLARERGDADGARREFRKALAAPDPSPGAARELAALALAEGKNAEARDAIGAYLAATGPDPDALSLEAVADVNLGDAARAVEAIRRARELVGGGERGAQLEARVRARAGDAAGAVAALRAVEGPERLLDREALRSDPAFLPIANDPAWIAFVNETGTAPASAAPSPAKKDRR